jgi:tetratricopeptide (TPR) repeat protein
VIGTGIGQECFAAAREGRSDLSALDVCNLAVADQGATKRDQAASMVNRGVVKLHRRDPAAALEDFNAAITQQPQLGEAYINRGAALIRLGEYAKAIASIDQGLALDPAEAHEAYFNRAIANEKLDNVTAAFRDYRKALELRPDWSLALEELQRFTVAAR